MAFSAHRVLGTVVGLPNGSLGRARVWPMQVEPTGASSPDDWLNSMQELWGSPSFDHDV
jgi:hypothetical protein